MDKEKDTTRQIVEQVQQKNMNKNNNPEGKGGFGYVNVKLGDNTRYLRHALAIYNLPPIDISDEKQVEERIGWYFNHCIENDMKPTVTGMANALGVDRRTIYDWSRGKVRSATHSPLVKKAMTMLEELWEDYMQNGKINPVSGIFLGKNHFGYQDSTEVVLTPNNNLGEQKSSDELREKYLPDASEDEDDV